jgi:hypothetical protein
MLPPLAAVVYGKARRIPVAQSRIVAVRNRPNWVGFLAVEIESTLVRLRSVAKRDISALPAARAACDQVLGRRASGRPRADRGYIGAKARAMRNSSRAYLPSPDSRPGITNIGGSQRECDIFPAIGTH